MKFQLSVVAIALLQAGVVSASGFDLANVNLDKVNQDKWQCKRCDMPSAKGEMGISLVGTDINDNKAANHFGEDSEFAGAVQADVVYTGASRLSVQAKDLGLETGTGSARFSSEHLGVEVGYQSQLTVKGDGATSLYGLDGDNLVALPNPQSSDLQVKRELWQLGSELKFDIGSAYVDYQLLERSGQQATSVQLNRSPVNFANPIDDQTQLLSAGGQIHGDNWLTALHYHGSVYDNGASSINQAERGSLQALAPDNEAHQVTAQGQYRFTGMNVTGQLSKGWLYQNQDFVSLESVPNGITHLDGEVETTDARLTLSTKPISDLILRGWVQYRDRDNQTPERLFAKVRYNPVTGVATQNVALDRTKTRYQIDGRYRINSHWQLLAGYELENVERNYSVREQTDDQLLFAQLNWKLAQQYRVKLRAEHSQRDGSDYEASNVTSAEDNLLLRKYHLADRDRNKVELKLGASPFDALSLDASLRYAKDDYQQNIESNSNLGLTESQDHGYDLAISYRINPQLSLSLYGGQQWIESTQLGSQSFTTSDWQGNVEDSFSHIGLGTRYTGLLQDQLTLGLDYDYSESESESSTSTTNSINDFGDYLSWGHRATLFADYQLSPNTKVRAQYRYLRGYDSDYSQLPAEAIPGLITLGQTNRNYQAHQLMLTLSYAL